MVDRVGNIETLVYAVRLGVYLILVALLAAGIVAYAEEQDSGKPADDSKEFGWVLAGTFLAAGLMATLYRVIADGVARGEELHEAEETGLVDRLRREDQEPGEPEGGSGSAERDDPGEPTAQ